MVGAAKSGQIWTCEKSHAYRVAAAGATICALALRGDQGVGVDQGRSYIWRPNPDSAVVRAAPL
jgi:hypothetical protein